MGFLVSTDQLIEFIKSNQWLAEPIVFLLGFAEGIPGLSLLVPSSVLFLGIGAAHGAAGGAFRDVWLAGSIGALAGDCLTYGLGRWYRNDSERLSRLGCSPSVLGRGERLLQSWGMPLIIGGKFLGFLRPFIPVVAGVAQMPWPLFFGASAVSSLLWAGAFLAPGYGIKWFMN